MKLQQEQNNTLMCGKELYSFRFDFMSCIYF